MADHFFAIIVYPESPTFTRERLHMHFIGDAALAPELQAALRAAIERWGSINREDLAIIERVQQGRLSSAFDGGQLSPWQDTGCHRFMPTAADYLPSDGPPVGDIATANRAA